MCQTSGDPFAIRKPQKILMIQPCEKMQVFMFISPA